MLGEIVPDRIVLSINGADRAAFLQGLITNDINRTGLIYAALLTPQGKYLADFFLHQTKDAYLLDVHAGLSAGLVQRFNMYRLRADVLIEQTDISIERGLGPCPADGFNDPRHPELGWRRYGSVGAVPDLAEWDALRVAHLIPESLIELIPNETYILEVNFEALNGVDFKKGCYVGQEVTARMKHKTSLRKGLARVKVAGAVPVGTPILRDDKTIGMLHTQSDSNALAYLRFDRAGAGMTANGHVVTLAP